LLPRPGPMPQPPTSATGRGAVRADSRGPRSATSSLSCGEGDRALAG
jgi:hypothetical protein